jgi:hypothetical protein
LHFKHNHQRVAKLGHHLLAVYHKPPRLLMYVGLVLWMNGSEKSSGLSSPRETEDVHQHMAREIPNPWLQADLVSNL